MKIKENIFCLVSLIKKNPEMSIYTFTHIIDRDSVVILMNVDNGKFVASNDVGGPIDR